MSKPVLALDIGGTKLAVGAVTEAGEVLAERVAPTASDATPGDVIALLLRMSKEVLARTGSAQGRPQAVGISFGGPVDFPPGRTVTCHHLPGWEDVALREMIADRTGLPTAMDNDANAAALAETRFGAARGCHHVLYLTVSTGIGGGLVLGGHVHRGADSAAGEIGHTIVVPDGPECTCGGRGHLEALASGPAIARRAREALDAGVESTLASLPRSELTARDVAESAATDPLAAKIITETGEYLGLAIAAAVNLVNPDIVVIGGGVSQAGELLLSAVRRAVQRHAVPQSTRGLRIVQGELGSRDALLGAAALALDLISSADARG